MIGAIALDKNTGASQPDVGRYGQAEMKFLRNLVAVLFRLEGSRTLPRTPDQVRGRL